MERWGLEWCWCRFLLEVLLLVQCYVSCGFDLLSLEVSEPPPPRARCPSRPAGPFALGLTPCHRCSHLFFSKSRPGLRRKPFLRRIDWGLSIPPAGPPARRLGLDLPPYHRFTISRFLADTALQGHRRPSRGNHPHTIAAHGDLPRRPPQIDESGAVRCALWIRAPRGDLATDSPRVNRTEF